MRRHPGPLHRRLVRQGPGTAATPGAQQISSQIFNEMEFGTPSRNLFADERSGTSSRYSGFVD
jgi:hypothetical protein